MAQANQRQRAARVRTHEGGPAQTGDVLQQLRRAVTSCLLWEKTFYESGEDIAMRIHSLATSCDANFVADLAVEVRKQHGLRHAPLWLILSLLPRDDITGKAKADAITNVISRCDELTEVIAMYWASSAHKGKEGVIPNALKTGVANAFEKFDEYQFGKYRGEGKSITLRDVLFLTHPKPSKEREGLYKRIADGELKTPDTWEVGLSTGGDKKETFTRLLEEGKLGYLATLRNIRNMVEAGVGKGLIKDRLNSPKGRKGVLPFQFISAAIMVPGFESELDNAMIACLQEMEMFPGKTCILVDTSGSMTSAISEKSILAAVDAASGMAIMARELCDDVKVYAWSTECREVPARRGMALRDAIRNTDVGMATYGDKAVQHALRDGPWDRCIIITDMQLHDGLQGYPEIPHKYIVNVRSYQNAVGYGNWTWIEGFSAQTLRFMRELEAIE